MRRLTLNEGKYEPHFSPEVAFVQKLLQVLIVESEEGSKQESENLFKSVTRGGVREIYRLYRLGR